MFPFGKRSKRPQPRQAKRSSLGRQRRFRFEQLEERRLLTTVFSEGFEGAFPGAAWAVSPSQSRMWDDTTSTAHNGSWSAHAAENSDGSSTNTYVNNLDTVMQRTASLSGYTSATLSFYYWLNSESGYDYFRVKVNGAQLFSDSGAKQSWNYKSLNLSSYAGQSSVTVQFEFTSDSSVVAAGAAGVWIDDILLDGAGATGDPPASIVPGGGTWVWPNPFGDAHRSGNIATATQYDTYAFMPDVDGNYAISTGGALDTQLRVYNSSGAALTGVIDRSYGGESTTQSLTGGNWHYVVVGGYMSDAGSYTLDFNGPDFTPSSIATSLPNNTGSSGSAMDYGGDVDYFRVVAPGGATSLNLTTTPAAALDTFVELYDNAGTRLQTINNAGAGAADSATGVAVVGGQTYYVGVSGALRSQTGSYTVGVDFNPDAIVDDGYEQNDAPGAASDLGTVTGQRVISNLVMADAGDWYKFTTAAAASAANYVRIDFSHSQGDLDLQLYDSIGVVVLGGSYSASNAEQVRLVDQITGAYLPAGTYLVRVYGYAGATNPNYTLTVNTPATPAADAWEPNDTVAAATNLGALAGSHTWTQRSIHSSADVDWIKFTTAATAGAGNSVRIDFVHAQGDVDMRLYDSTGTTLLGVSTGGSNSEQISLVNASSGAYLPAGAYLVRVNGYGGAMNPDYSLTVNAPTPPTSWEEPNDARSTAYDLGVATGTRQWPSAGIASSGDQDWFRFTTLGAGGSANFVRIDFTHAQGDVDMQLFDAAGQLLRESHGVSESERISFDGLQAGPYFLKVYGVSGAANPAYVLSMNAPTGSSGITPDAYEPNDAAAAAYDLRQLTGQQTWQNLSIHAAGNNDWFKFQTAATGAASDFVRIDFTQAQGDLDLQLYDAGGNLLRGSSGTSDSEQVSLAGRVAGTYLVWIYGYSGALNPNYALTISAPANTIAADPFEPNDALATAADLRTLSGQNNRWDNLSIHAAGNDDWYKFTTTAAGGASDAARLEFSNAQGDLNLGLYDSAGTLLAASASAGDGESLSLSGRAAGAYYVRVYGVSNVTNPTYSLVIDAPPAPSTTRQWTVMVYVDADNDLEGDGIIDLNEMEAAVLPGNVTVAVQMDRIGGYNTSNGNWTDTRRGSITHDTNTATISSALTSVGELNMGAPDTLRDFIIWASTTYPAENYALVMWDHGAGLNGVSVDDTSAGDSLSMVELNAAISGSNVHFGMVGFDACLMDLFEQAYQLRSLSDVVVASEALIPYAGQNYTTFFNALAVSPSMTPEQLGGAMVTAYGNNYGNHETLAATRSSAYAALATALTSFADVVAAQATAADWTQIIQARQATAYYTLQTYRDLKGFMSRVASSTAAAAIRTAAQTVAGAVDAAVVRNHSGTVEAATGLSIYLPGPGSSIDSRYTAANYDLAADTRWRDFLLALTAQSPTGALASTDGSALGASGRAMADAVDLRQLAGHILVGSYLLDPAVGGQWFTFETLTTGGAADAVSIAFQNAWGNLDLELFDSNGGLLGSSTGAGDAEQVSLSGLAAGRYYIRVLGPQGNPTYALTIDAPTTGTIEEDWAGANHTQEKAFNLVSFSGDRARFVGLTMDGSASNPTREDWFSLDVSRSTQLNPNRVQLQFSNAQGNLDLYVYDENGVLIGSSSTTNDNETVNLPGSLGKLYIRAAGAHALVTNPAYALELNYDVSALGRPTTSGAYDPIASRFYLKYANSEGFADAEFGFGAPGWKPLAGDWDGDGCDTIGLYDPATGMFYLRNSHTTGIADIAFPYGSIGSGWTPLIGDWDGNGEESAGFYQPGAASHFYLRNDFTAGIADVHFGLGFAGVQPIVGDWLGPTGQSLKAESGNLKAESGRAASASLIPDPQSLIPLVSTAIARWADAGVSIAMPQVVVTDLPGAEVGRAQDNTIYLDRDAAGHGWFVDPTPAVDEEFSSSGAAVDPRAVDRIDLLTVIEHELGHLAGLSDLDASLETLMSDSLPTGVRRNPRL